MASKGYVQTLLNRIKDADTKAAVLAAFEYVLDNLQIGGAEHTKRATNFQWYRFDSTTASTANDEFTIPHGLAQIPARILHLLPIDSSGTALVRLEVSRPADASRIYLRSPDVAKPISLYVEI